MAPAIFMPKTEAATAKTLGLL